jgi:hypothetical protein
MYGSTLGFANGKVSTSQGSEVLQCSVRAQGGLGIHCGKGCFEAKTMENHPPGYPKLMDVGKEFWIVLILMKDDGRKASEFGDQLELVQYLLRWFYLAPGLHV